MNNSYKYLNYFGAGLILARLKVYLIFYALFVILNSSAAFSQENSGTGILFLQCRMTGNEIKVIDAKLRSGNLKLERSNSEVKELTYELISPNESLIYSGSISDPLTRLLEYADPENPGGYKAIVVNRESADFILRLPYRKDLYQLTFYRNEIPANLKGGQKILRKALTKINMDFINNSELNDK